MANTNDDTLLQQWQNGDEVAFELIYKKYLKLLLHITLKKTGDFELSREIVQETFIVFYKKKDKIEDNPFLYLQRILKFKILEYYRKAKKNKEDNVDIIPHTLDNNLWDKILLNDTNAIVMKLIASLPLQQRKIFLLSRIEQLSNKEIATALNISVKTVEASITKSIKTIKKFNVKAIIGMLLQLGMI